MGREGEGELYQVALDLYIDKDQIKQLPLLFEVTVKCCATESSAESQHCTASTFERLTQQRISNEKLKMPNKRLRITIIGAG